MNGRFVGLQMTMGDSSRWFVNAVTPEARQAVGPWPTAESLVSQLVCGLDVAGEQETDPERKSRLRQAATLLGGAARDVVVDIAAKVIERGARLGWARSAGQAPGRGRQQPDHGPRPCPNPGIAPVLEHAS
jgi:hypothetical protein